MPLRISSFTRLLAIFRMRKVFNSNYPPHLWGSYVALRKEIENCSGQKKMILPPLSIMPLSYYGYESLLEVVSIFSNVLSDLATRPEWLGDVPIRMLRVIWPKFFSRRIVRSPPVAWSWGPEREGEADSGNGLSLFSDSEFLAARCFPFWGGKKWSRGLGWPRLIRRIRKHAWICILLCTWNQRIHVDDTKKDV